MNRIINTSAAFILASALLVPGVSRGQEIQDAPAPLQMGPVIVQPALTLKETYNDNVFFTDENAKDDFITSVLPELTLKLPFRMHQLTLGASAEFVKYADNSNLDTSPYQVYGLGEFSIGDRVRLKIGDTYLRGEESPQYSPNGTSDEYTSNAAGFSVKYAFVDVSQLQLDYTRTALDYLDSSYRTRDEDLMSVYLYYRVMPNTSAFVEYEFKNVAYENTASDDVNLTATKYDNVVHSGFIGATWEITEFSKGTAKAGFLKKGYEDDALEDYSTWTASVDLQHRLSDAASLRLIGKRDVNEGKTTDVGYYTSTGVFAEFTYYFLERLSGVFDGSYAVEDFLGTRQQQDATREDKTARIGIGAKYSFTNWLDLALGYNFTNRDSNIAGYDAASNAVTLKVTAYR